MDLKLINGGKDRSSVMLFLLPLCTWLVLQIRLFRWLFRTPLVAALPFWIHKMKFPSATALQLVMNSRLSYPSVLNSSHVNCLPVASVVFQTAVPVNGTNNSRTRLETNKNNTANMGWWRQWLSNSYNPSRGTSDRHTLPREVTANRKSNWWLTSLLKITFHKNSHWTQNFLSWEVKHRMNWSTIFQMTGKWMEEK